MRCTCCTCRTCALGQVKKTVARNFRASGRELVVARAVHDGVQAAELGNPNRIRYSER